MYDCYVLAQGGSYGCDFRLCRWSVRDPVFWRWRLRIAASMEVKLPTLPQTPRAKGGAAPAKATDMLWRGAHKVAPLRSLRRDDRTLSVGAAALVGMEQGEAA